MQQDVLNHVDNRQEEQLEAEKDEADTNPADETMTLEELEEKCLKNLEMLTQKAAAAVERSVEVRRRGNWRRNCCYPWMRSHPSECSSVGSGRSKDSHLSGAENQQERRRN